MQQGTLLKDLFNNICFHKNILFYTLQWNPMYIKTW